MSLFATAQAQSANVKVEEKDVLGGSFNFPSNIYPAGVKMAYLDKWDSGALYVAFEFAVLVDGQERTHKENITISNREGSFTYNDKDGKPQPMAGYALVDSIFKMITGVGFNQQKNVEIKSVSVYDKDAKGNVNKDKEVFMDVIRQKVNLGIILQKVDKTVKNTSTNKYEPTGEFREENVIHKVFEYGTNLSLPEKEAGKPAEFYKSWLDRFSGKVIDKSKGKPANAGGVQQGAPNNAGVQNPLFG